MHAPRCVMPSTGLTRRMAECKALLREEVITHHDGYALTLSRREAMLLRWLLGLTRNSSAIITRIATDCKVGDASVRADCEALQENLRREMKRAGQIVVPCSITYSGMGKDGFTTYWREP